MSMDGHKASLNDGGFLFRFRSAKALLDDNLENGGFQELEKQTIYFAQPEDLNDPMEGLSDAFWDGDQVLRKNFFRHYALSLIWYASKNRNVRGDRHSRRASRAFRLASADRRVSTRKA